MKTTLLLFRVPEDKAIALAKNLALWRQYDISLISDFPLEAARESGHFIDCISLPRAGEGMYRPEHFEEVQDLALAVIRRRGVSKAVIVTPLFWMSEAVRMACAKARIESIWSEVFLTEKLLFDRIGCQYTADNEIMRYADRAPRMDPEPLGPTRFPQPPGKGPAALRAELGGAGPAIVLFGQVPSDNSLRDVNGCMSYPQWIDAVVSANRETRFLFKHHPAHRTPGTERHPNLRAVNESVGALLAAFDAFAAYSSTTIIEGAAAGRIFATGGHHFLSGPGLTIKVASARYAGGLHERLVGAKPDQERLRRRLGFVTRRYALRPSSPEVARRLAVSSDEFFLG